MEPVTSKATKQHCKRSSRPPAPQVIHFSNLSTPHQVLVRLFEVINYGYIQGMDVTDTDTVLEENVAGLRYIKRKVDRKFGQVPICRPEVA